MKVPTEALTIITAAASNISSKHAAVDTPSIKNNAAISRPQLQQKLTTHDPSASDATAHNNQSSQSHPQLPRRLNTHLTNALDEHQDVTQSVATRLLQDYTPTSCDASFLKCILSPTCRGCFQTLQENNIDWANVVPETPCQDVLGYLVAGGHCQEVRSGGADEQDTFCGAFDSCVVWDDEDESPKGAGGKEAIPGDEEAMDVLDCTALTECSWPGIHEQFLGDGVCHENMPGCYNSKACNYDGGDCCKDTCHYPGQTTNGADDYGECGQEGYVCRDPSSIDCQPALARQTKTFCSFEEDEDASFDGSEDDFFRSDEDERISCLSSERLYRLVQYDSWGDGWDNTVLKVNLHSDMTSPPIYEGGLKYGSQGTVYLCLAKKEAKCYHVSVENGVWGNEISWELRPMAGGAPALAAGGSPTDCTVAIGGTLPDCPNNCDSTRPDTKIDDPNYKSYKDMESCIEAKCLIQVGNCAQDDSCSECMQETTPDFCFANDNFNTLIDCSMCSCTENRPAYCDAKISGAASAGGSSSATHEGNFKPAAGGSANGNSDTCGPEQTLKGTTSLIKFSECANVDQMMAMVTDFDNNNFGALDLFEACAHAYDGEPLHGGKTAMGCMAILHNLIVDDEDETSSGTPFKNANGDPLPDNIGKAISTLAHHLYHDAEEFCDCSATVNKETPMCSSFINFKTLMYEAVDACKSLDQIDCAAWEEFTTPCKQNLQQMFDTVDFDKPEQCTYVESQCGGAGPFPAFRRLDCGGEIAKSAWDFHTMYERGCLKSSSSGSVPTPAVTPSTPSTPSGPASTPSYTKPSSAAEEKKQYKPYDPNGATDEKKPYYSKSDPVPEEDDTTNYKEKKKHHFVRNTFILAILAGVGYVMYKKRKENFNYMRFRQLREARNYAGGLNAGGGGEYTGVSMADSCSFEPPTLPPTPSDNANMI